MSARGLPFALGLLLLGCPKEEAGPDDRLLQKLKAEQARLAAQPHDARGAPGQPAPLPPEDDPLAGAATAPEAPRTLPLPGQLDVEVDKVRYRLTGLEASGQVGAGKLKLTTTDAFLRVSLRARADGAAEADLGAASLKHQDRTFPLARDVQRLAGTKELRFAVPGGDGADLDLFFEVPKDALGKGLLLVLPVPGGPATVEVPLQ